MCFHGKGGYDWFSVYNIPIHHRKFIYHQMEEFYKKQNNQDKGEKSWNDPKIKERFKNDQKLHPPDFFKLLKGKPSFE